MQQTPKRFFRNAHWIVKTCFLRVFTLAELGLRGSRPSARNAFTFRPAFLLRQGFAGHVAGMTIVLMATLAMAAEAPSPVTAAAPTLDPAFCQRLVKHTPDADVAYQPGIDVHGRPVVPADLDGGPTVKLPEEISIPLTADLFHFLNVDQSKFPFNSMGRTDINIGTITVKGDKVFMNGQPLTDTEQDRLAVLCMKPR